MLEHLESRYDVREATEILEEIFEKFDESDQRFSTFTSLQPLREITSLEGNVVFGKHSVRFLKARTDPLKE